MSDTQVRKSTQVSATIPAEKFAALEDYRWENRVNKMSDVVAEAVDLFIETKGLKVAAPAPAPAVAEAPAAETPTKPAK